MNLSANSGSKDGILYIFFYYEPAVCGATREFIDPATVTHPPAVSRYRTLVMRLESKFGVRVITHSSHFSILLEYTRVVGNLKSFIERLHAQFFNNLVQSIFILWRRFYFIFYLFLIYLFNLTLERRMLIWVPQRCPRENLIRISWLSKGLRWLRGYLIEFNRDQVDCR